MPSPVVDAGPDDTVLVAQFRRGDTQSFSLLVTRYQKPIYNAAFRVTGNAQDASEVAQAVFLKVFERIADYDPHHKFFSWIYRIAVNEAVDVLRRTSREEPLDDDSDFDGGGDPQAGYEAREQAARVQMALRQLAVDDRVVLTLRHYCDCDYREIARILTIEEKTVKSRLFEARRRLATRVEGMGAVRPS